MSAQIGENHDRAALYTIVGTGSDLNLRGAPESDLCWVYKEDASVRSWNSGILQHRAARLPCRPLIGSLMSAAKVGQVSGDANGRPKRGRGMKRSAFNSSPSRQADGTSADLRHDY
jgi:hypothetical protein